jgi:hypothetical protein
VPNGGKVNKEGVMELRDFIQTYNKRVTNLLNEKIFTQIRREIASRAGTVTPNMASQQSLINNIPDSAITPYVF